MNRPHPLSTRAFTLIEVMVSVTILAMIMVIVSTVIGQAQRSWRAASSRVTQFREARQAFETLSRNLRQAVLPTYVDFRYGPGGTRRDPLTLTDVPTAPSRGAELGFRFGDASSLVTGGGGSSFTPGHAVIFQMPSGSYSNAALTAPDATGLAQMTRTLSPRGYFLRFGGDRSYLPAGLAARLKEKHRYRLFEYLPTSDANTQVWDPTDQLAPDVWTNINAASVTDLHPVAENILIMAFAASFGSPDPTVQVDLDVPVTNTSATASLLTAYNSYNSTQSRPPTTEYANRLPRSMLVTMVAIDEDSATRLAAESKSAPHSPLPGGGATLFSNAANLNTDLQSVRTSLIAAKVNFRIFSALVLIPGADTRAKQLLANP